MGTTCARPCATGGITHAAPGGGGGSPRGSAPSAGLDCCDNGGGGGGTQTSILQVLDKVILGPGKELRPRKGNTARLRRRQAHDVSGPPSHVPHRPGGHVRVKLPVGSAIIVQGKNGTKEKLWVTKGCMQGANENRRGPPRKAPRWAQDAPQLPPQAPRPPTLVLPCSTQPRIHDR
jgi:hypothetical protein